MLQKTAAIALRNTKYGESSLVCTTFTRENGVQSFMLKGIRNPKSGQSRAGLLQAGSLLDLVIYHQPAKNLQSIREMTPAHYYQSAREDMVKSSILLFSVELLLKLLPENASMPALFDFTKQYLCSLDQCDRSLTGNYPLYFSLQCGAFLGYKIQGHYSAETPYLDLSEGAFISNHPGDHAAITAEDGAYLDKIQSVPKLADLPQITMSSASRHRLLEWYIVFLQNHTQHMGQIKSLPILQAILH